MSAVREQVAEAWEKFGGNISQIAKHIDRPRSLVQYHAAKLGLRDRPIASGQIEERPTIKKPLPAKGKISRYILTCAQNNTHIHEKVWENLLALAEHYGAEVMVSRLTYNKAAYQQRPSKPGTSKSSDGDQPWYAPEISEYVVDDRVELAPTLVFCGELNVIPTAERPLRGLDTYTQQASGIVPHVKLAMSSVPRVREEPPKFMYTTGTVTRRNYIQQKAGQKADFHHVYGALIVEVDPKGRWWVRQLTADSKGTIYDLDVMASAGRVGQHSDIEAVTWGDIHVRDLDPTLRDLFWASNGVLDALKPKFQIMHDLMAGDKTCHHEWNNPLHQFELHASGRDTVFGELDDTALFLAQAYRPWCTSVIVGSNHDNPWLEKWIAQTDYRKDPANALAYLRLATSWFESAKRGVRANLLEVAMKGRLPEAMHDYLFLEQDASFTICDGQIECAMHGHLGPNGSNGAPSSIARMGRRANTAHTHTAEIVDGLFVAGTSTVLNPKYAKGPTSWSHSFIVTYANGKRAMITVWEGLWRAEASRCPHPRHRPRSKNLPRPRRPRTCSPRGGTR